MDEAVAIRAFERAAAALAVAIVLAAGCAAPAPDATPMPPFDARAAEWAHTAGAGGFDCLDADAVWSPGDVARYRVASCAAGERRTWIVEFRLPAVPTALPEDLEPTFGDPASGFLRVANALPQTTGDRDRGHEARYAHYPVDLRVRVQRQDGGGAFTVDVPTQVQAHVWHERVDTNPTFGIDFLFRVLVRVDRLLEELLHVVKPPSTWSVVRNGMRVAVDLELHPEPDVAVFDVSTPFGTLPAFWLPATLHANGQDALALRFLITWRRSPLLLTMGVLRIEGRHPDDASRWVEAQLIAARRGSEQPVDRDRLGAGLRRGMTEAEFVAAVHGVVSDRYRVANAAGRCVDLVCTQCPGALPRLVGVFEGQRLLYGSHPGMVGMFLELHGFEKGPFRPENRIPLHGGEAPR